MTGRASFLRRVSKLEDLEARRVRGQHVTEEDISAALDDLEDAHLWQLEDAATSGRWGQGDAFGGPLALDVLGLKEGAEGPHGWAWAYLSGAARDLPAGCPAAFRAACEDLEDRAADLEDGEEKTRLLDGAAGWAYLEALARVLEVKGGL